jgi:hypothetical protein
MSSAGFKLDRTNFKIFFEFFFDAADLTGLSIRVILGLSCLGTAAVFTMWKYPTAWTRLLTRWGISLLGTWGVMGMNIMLVVKFLWKVADILWYLFTFTLHCMWDFTVVMVRLSMLLYSHFWASYQKWCVLFVEWLWERLSGYYQLFDSFLIFLIMLFLITSFVFFFIVYIVMFIYYTIEFIIPFLRYEKETWLFWERVRWGVKRYPFWTAGFGVFALWSDLYKELTQMFQIKQKQLKLSWWYIKSRWLKIQTECKTLQISFGEWVWQRVTNFVRTKVRQILTWEFSLNVGFGLWSYDLKSLSIGTIVESLNLYSKIVGQAILGRVRWLRSCLFIFWTKILRVKKKVVKYIQKLEWFLNIILRGLKSIINVGLLLLKRLRNWVWVYYSNLKRWIVRMVLSYLTSVSRVITFISFSCSLIFSLGTILTRGWEWFIWYISREIPMRVWEMPFWIGSVVINNFASSVLFGVAIAVVILGCQNRLEQAWEWLKTDFWLWLWLILKFLMITHLSVWFELLIATWVGINLTWTFFFVCYGLTWFISLYFVLRRYNIGYWIILKSIGANFYSILMSLMSLLVKIVFGFWAGIKFLWKVVIELKIKMVYFWTICRWKIQRLLIIFQAQIDIWYTLWLKESARSLELTITMTKRGIWTMWMYYKGFYERVFGKMFYTLDSWGDISIFVSVNFIFWWCYITVLKEIGKWLVFLYTYFFEIPEYVRRWISDSIIFALISQNYVVILFLFVVIWVGFQQINFYWKIILNYWNITQYWVNKIKIQIRKMFYYLSLLIFEFILVVVLSWLIFSGDAFLYFSNLIKAAIIVFVLHADYKAKKTNSSFFKIWVDWNSQVTFVMQQVCAAILYVIKILRYIFQIIKERCRRTKFYRTVIPFLRYWVFNIQVLVLIWFFCIWFWLIYFITPIVEWEEIGGLVGRLYIWLVERRDHIFLLGIWSFMLIINHYFESFKSSMRRLYDKMPSVFAEDASPGWGLVGTIIRWAILYVICPFLLSFIVAREAFLDPNCLCLAYIVVITTHLYFIKYCGQRFFLTLGVRRKLWEIIWEWIEVFSISLLLIVFPLYCMMFIIYSLHGREILITFYVELIICSVLFSWRYFWQLWEIRRRLEEIWRWSVINIFPRVKEFVNIIVEFLVEIKKLSRFILSFLDKIQQWFPFNLKELLKSSWMWFSRFYRWIFVKLTYISTWIFYFPSVRLYKIIYAGWKKYKKFYEWIFGEIACVFDSWEYMLMFCFIHVGLWEGLRLCLFVVRDLYEYTKNLNIMVFVFQNYALDLLILVLVLIVWGQIVFYNKEYSYYYKTVQNWYQRLIIKGKKFLYFLLWFILYLFAILLLSWLVFSSSTYLYIENLLKAGLVIIIVQIDYRSKRLGECFSRTFYNLIYRGWTTVVVLIRDLISTFKVTLKYIVQFSVDKIKSKFDLFSLKEFTNTLREKLIRLGRNGKRILKYYSSYLLWVLWLCRLGVIFLVSVICLNYAVFQSFEIYNLFLAFVVVVVTRWSYMRRPKVKYLERLIRRYFSLFSLTVLFYSFVLLLDIAGSVVLSYIVFRDYHFLDFYNLFLAFVVIVILQWNFVSRMREKYLDFELDEFSLGVYLKKFIYFLFKLSLLLIGAICLNYIVYQSFEIYNLFLAFVVVVIARWSYVRRPRVRHLELLVSNYFSTPLLTIVFYLLVLLFDVLGSIVLSYIVVRNPYFLEFYNLFLAFVVIVILQWNFINRMQKKYLGFTLDELSLGAWFKKFYYFLFTLSLLLLGTICLNYIVFQSFEIYNLFLVFVVVVIARWSYVRRPKVRHLERLVNQYFSLFSLTIVFYLFVLFFDVVGSVILSYIVVQNSYFLDFYNLFLAFVVIVILQWNFVGRMRKKYLDFVIDEFSLGVWFKKFIYFLFKLSSLILCTICLNYIVFQSLEIYNLFLAFVVVVIARWSYVRRPRVRHLERLVSRYFSTPLLTIVFYLLVLFFDVLGSIVLSYIVVQNSYFLEFYNLFLAFVVIVILQWNFINRMQKKYLGFTLDEFSLGAWLKKFFYFLLTPSLLLLGTICLNYIVFQSFEIYNLFLAFVVVVIARWSYVRRPRVRHLERLVNQYFSLFSLTIVFYLFVLFFDVVGSVILSYIVVQNSYFLDFYNLFLAFVVIVILQWNFVGRMRKKYFDFVLDEFSLGVWFKKFIYFLFKLSSLILCTICLNYIVFQSFEIYNLFLAFVVVVIARWSYDRRPRVRHLERLVSRYFSTPLLTIVFYLLVLLFDVVGSVVLSYIVVRNPYFLEFYNLFLAFVVIVILQWNFINRMQKKYLGFTLDELSLGAWFKKFFYFLLTPSLLLLGTICLNYIVFQSFEIYNLFLAFVVVVIARWSYVRRPRGRHLERLVNQYFSLFSLTIVFYLFVLFFDVVGSVILSYIVVQNSYFLDFYNLFLAFVVIVILQWNFVGRMRKKYLDFVLDEFLLGVWLKKFIYFLFKLSSLILCTICLNYIVFQSFEIYNLFLAFVVVVIARWSYVRRPRVRHLERLVSRYFSTPLLTIVFYLLVLLFDVVGSVVLSYIVVRNPYFLEFYNLFLAFVVIVILQWNFINRMQKKYLGFTLDELSLGAWFKKFFYFLLTPSLLLLGTICLNYIVFQSFEIYNLFLAFVVVVIARWSYVRRPRGRHLERLVNQYFSLFSLTIVFYLFVLFFDVVGSVILSYIVVHNSYFLDFYNLFLAFVVIVILQWNFVGRMRKKYLDFVLDEFSLGVWFKKFIYFLFKLSSLILCTICLNYIVFQSFEIYNLFLAFVVVVIARWSYVRRPRVRHLERLVSRYFSTPLLTIVFYLLVLLFDVVGSVVLSYIVVRNPYFLEFYNLFLAFVVIVILQWNFINRMQKKYLGFTLDELSLGAWFKRFSYFLLTPSLLLLGTICLNYIVFQAFEIYNLFLAFVVVVIARWSYVRRPRGRHLERLVNQYFSLFSLTIVFYLFVLFCDVVGSVILSYIVVHNSYFLDFYNLFLAFVVIVILQWNFVGRMRKKYLDFALDEFSLGVWFKKFIYFLFKLSSLILCTICLNYIVFQSFEIYNLFLAFVVVVIVRWSYVRRPRVRHLERLVSRYFSTPLLTIVFYLLVLLFDVVGSGVLSYIVVHDHHFLEFYNLFLAFVVIVILQWNFVSRMQKKYLGFTLDELSLGAWFKKFCYFLFTPGLLLLGTICLNYIVFQSFEIYNLILAFVVVVVARWSYVQRPRVRHLERLVSRYFSTPLLTIVFYLLVLLFDVLGSGVLSYIVVRDPHFLEFYNLFLAFVVIVILQWNFVSRMQKKYLGFTLDELSLGAWFKKFCYFLFTPGLLLLGTICLNYIVFQSFEIYNLILAFVVVVIARWSYVQRPKVRHLERLVSRYFSTPLLTIVFYLLVLLFDVLGSGVLSYIVVRDPHFLEFYNLFLAFVVIVILQWNFVSRMQKKYLGFTLDDLSLGAWFKKFCYFLFTPGLLLLGTICLNYIVFQSFEIYNLILAFVVVVIARWSYVQRPRVRHLERLVSRYFSTPLLTIVFYLLVLLFDVLGSGVLSYIVVHDHHFLEFYNLFLAFVVIVILQWNFVSRMQKKYLGFTLDEFSLGAWFKKFCYFLFTPGLLLLGTICLNYIVFQSFEIYNLILAFIVVVIARWSYVRRPRARHLERLIKRYFSSFFLAVVFYLFVLFFDVVSSIILSYIVVRDYHFLEFYNLFLAFVVIVILQWNFVSRMQKKYLDFNLGDLLLKLGLLFVSSICLTYVVFQSFEIFNLFLAFVVVVIARWSYIRRSSAGYLGRLVRRFLLQVYSNLKALAQWIRGLPNQVVYFIIVRKKHWWAWYKEWFFSIRLSLEIELCSKIYYEIPVNFRIIGRQILEMVNKFYFKFVKILVPAHLFITILLITCVQYLLQLLCKIWTLVVVGWRFKNWFGKKVWIVIMNVYNLFLWFKEIRGYIVLFYLYVVFCFICSQIQFYREQILNYYKKIRWNRIKSLVKIIFYTILLICFELFTVLVLSFITFTSSTFSNFYNLVLSFITITMLEIDYIFRRYRRGLEVWGLILTQNLKRVFYWNKRWFQVIILVIKRTFNYVKTAVLANIRSKYNQILYLYEYLKIEIFKWYYYISNLVFELLSKVAAITSQFEIYLYNVFIGSTDYKFDAWYDVVAVLYICFSIIFGSILLLDDLARFNIFRAADFWLMLEYYFRDWWRMLISSITLKVCSFGLFLVVISYLIYSQLKFYFKNLFSFYCRTRDYLFVRWHIKLENICSSIISWLKFISLELVIICILSYLVFLEHSFLRLYNLFLAVVVAVIFQILYWTRRQKEGFFKTVYYTLVRFVRYIKQILGILNIYIQIIKSSRKKIKRLVLYIIKNIRIKINEAFWIWEQFIIEIQNETGIWWIYFDNLILSCWKRLVVQVEWLITQVRRFITQVRRFIAQVQSTNFWSTFNYIWRRVIQRFWLWLYKHAVEGLLEGFYSWREVFRFICFWIWAWSCINVVFVYGWDWVVFGVSQSISILIWLVWHSCKFIINFMLNFILTMVWISLGVFVWTLLEKIWKISIRWWYLSQNRILLILEKGKNFCWAIIKIFFKIFIVVFLSYVVFGAYQTFELYNLFLALLVATIARIFYLSKITRKSVVQIWLELLHKIYKQFIKIFSWLRSLMSVCRRYYSLFLWSVKNAIKQYQLLILDLYQLEVEIQIMTTRPQKLNCTLSKLFEVWRSAQDSLRFIIQCFWKICLNCFSWLKGFVKFVLIFYPFLIWYFSNLEGVNTFIHEWMILQWHRVNEITIFNQGWLYSLLLFIVVVLFLGWTQIRFYRVELSRFKTSCINWLRFILKWIFYGIMTIVLNSFGILILSYIVFGSHSFFTVFHILLASIVFFIVRGLYKAKKTGVSFFSIARDYYSSIVLFVYDSFTFLYMLFTMKVTSIKVMLVFFYIRIKKRWKQIECKWELGWVLRQINKLSFWLQILCALYMLLLAWISCIIIFMVLEGCYLLTIENFAIWMLMIKSSYVSKLIFKYYALLFFGIVVFVIFVIQLKSYEHRIRLWKFTLQLWYKHRGKVKIKSIVKVFMFLILEIMWIILLSWIVFQDQLSLYFWNLCLAGVVLFIAQFAYMLRVRRVNLFTKYAPLVKEFLCLIWVKLQRWVNHIWNEIKQIVRGVCWVVLSMTLIIVLLMIIQWYWKIMIFIVIFSILVSKVFSAILIKEIVIKLWAVLYDVYTAVQTCLYFLEIDFYFNIPTGAVRFYLFKLIDKLWYSIIILSCILAGIVVVIEVIILQVLQLCFYSVYIHPYYFWSFVGASSPVLIIFNILDVYTIFIGISGFALVSFYFWFFEKWTSVSWINFYYPYSNLDVFFMGIANNSKNCRVTSKLSLGKKLYELLCRLAFYWLYVYWWVTWGNCGNALGSF